METGPPMKARLARSGHLSSVIGHLMVVSGGILRDGSLCMDLVILDLSTLTFIRLLSHYLRPYSSCMRSCCRCSALHALPGLCCVAACCRTCLPLCRLSSAGKGPSVSFIMQSRHHHMPDLQALFHCQFTPVDMSISNGHSTNALCSDALHQR